MKNRFCSANSRKNSRPSHLAEGAAFCGHPAGHGGAFYFSQFQGQLDTIKRLTQNVSAQQKLVALKAAAPG